MTERSQPIDKDAVTPAMLEAWTRYEPADGFDVANESGYNEVVVHMRHAFISGYLAALAHPTEQTDDAVVAALHQCRRLAANATGGDRSYFGKLQAIGSICNAALAKLESRQ